MDEQLILLRRSLLEVSILVNIFKRRAGLIKVTSGGWETKVGGQSDGVVGRGTLFISPLTSLWPNPKQWSYLINN